MGHEIFALWLGLAGSLLACLAGLVMRSVLTGLGLGVSGGIGLIGLGNGLQRLVCLAHSSYHPGGICWVIPLRAEINPAVTMIGMQRIATITFSRTTLPLMNSGTQIPMRLLQVCHACV